MWLYVPEFSRSAQAMEDSTTLSQESSEALARSAWSRGKPLLPRAWSRRWKKERWLQRLSGATCSPSTLQRGVDAWISSLRDSHASQSPRLDEALPRLTTDGSGLESPRSSESASPTPCSSKTCPACCLRTEAPRTKKSRHRWPKWASMRSGAVSARPKWGPPTSVSGGSAWPTSRNQDSYERRNAPTMWKILEHGGDVTLPTKAWGWPTATARDHKDGACATANVPLASLLGRVSVGWPTARTGDAKQGPSSTAKHLLSGDWMLTDAAETFPAWSTIRATGGEKGGPNMQFGAGGTPLPSQAAAFPTGPQAQKTCACGGTCLQDILSLLPPSGRKLNPRFVEWLMLGRPGLGMTDFGFSETASSSTKPKRL